MSDTVPWKHVTPHCCNTVLVEDNWRNHPVNVGGQGVNSKPLLQTSWCFSWLLLLLQGCFHVGKVKIWLPIEFWVGDCLHWNTLDRYPELADKYQDSIELSVNWLTRRSADEDPPKDLVMSDCQPSLDRWPPAIVLTRMTWLFSKKPLKRRHCTYSLLSFRFPRLKFTSCQDSWLPLGVMGASSR